MKHLLDTVVHDPACDTPMGITSVCSAHFLVIEAALEQGKVHDGPVLIEATSNQVDQFGGYTGLRPIDFRRRVEHIAHKVGFPTERLVLGGDHLGPNRWRGLPAADAMAHSDDLIRSYVAAGYTKLHLDCSYPCADDAATLTDDVMAARATRMLEAAEDEAARVGLQGALRYVIGTEVPTPGGADHPIDHLLPTTAHSARDTLGAHRRAFGQAGLEQVWPQVMALVVQPAVEFDTMHVVDYRSAATEELRDVLDDEPTMTFEAHSTDYQTATALRSLVTDGWRVLKVGPGLTFALREALFALAAIEDELVPADERSRLPDIVESQMLAEPGHWAQHYPEGDALARRYSYSDRMRYYWADCGIDAAVQTLLENLSARTIPEPLLSAFLPEQYDRVRAGLLRSDPRSLVLDRVRAVLRTYETACATAEHTLVSPC